jgi:hypothetical protein
LAARQLLVFIATKAPFMRLAREKCRTRVVKNTAQLHTLFGLANLMIAKRRLLALNGQVAP